MDKGTSHLSGLTHQFGWRMYMYVGQFGGGGVNISILHQVGSCSPNFDQGDVAPTVSLCTASCFSFLFWVTNFAKECYFCLFLPFRKYTLRALQENIHFAPTFRKTTIYSFKNSQYLQCPRMRIHERTNQTLWVLNFECRHKKISFFEKVYLLWKKWFSSLVLPKVLKWRGHQLQQQQQQPR